MNAHHLALMCVDYEELSDNRVGGRSEAIRARVQMARTSGTSFGWVCDVDMGVAGICLFAFGSARLGLE
jgi:hypothetical protein